MSEPMQDPAEMQRERASDVPEGAELRADGSYVDPKATEDQKALRDAESDAAEQDEAKRQELLQREEGAQAPMPREQGTTTGTATAQAPEPNQNP